jgi:hypothetical protein
MEIIRDHISDKLDTLVKYEVIAAESQKAAVALLVHGGVDRGSVQNNNLEIEGSQWRNQQISDTLCNTYQMSAHPAQLVDENSVLELSYAPNSDYNETYPSTVGGSTTDFKIEPSSTGLFDATILATISLPSAVFSDNILQGDATESLANVKAEFDQGDANVHTHNAMNSEHNTAHGATYNLFATRGDKPLALKEAHLFNTFGAAGSNGLSQNGFTAKFASTNSDGSLNFTDISPSHQPNANHLLVEERVLANQELTADDIGTFRVQQADSQVHVSLSLNNISSSVSNIENGPLMNANKVASLTNSTTNSDVSLPQSLDHSNFMSLFSEEVRNSVRHSLKFTTTIQGSASSGYKVTLEDQLIDNTRKQLIGAIDNSGLKDAPRYMEQYVNEPHSIEFVSGVVSMVDGTNAVPATTPTIAVNQVAGEVLDSGKAGSHGQIVLECRNPLTRPTEVSGSASMNVANCLSVWYANDHNVGTRPTIAAEFEQNPHLSARIQKVAQDSATLPTVHPTHSLKSSNSATLSYYANGLVNTLLDGNIVTFNNLNQIPNDRVRLFDINSSRKLVAEPESLYAGWDDTTNLGTGLNTNFRVDAIMRNLIADNMTYSSFRTKLSPKKKGDLSLSAAIAGKSNWTLSTTGTNTDAFLKPSSDNAFDLFGMLPNFSENLVANFAPLYYKIELKTKTSSSMLGGLSDYVEILYADNANFTNATVQQINQTLLTRTQVANSASTVITPVSDALWNFKASSEHSKENWELVAVERVSRYNVSFILRYSCFNNLQMGISNIRQTQNSYALRNKNTQQLSGLAALQEVESNDIPNLHVISESIRAHTDGQVLSITGIMTSDDLRPFTAQIEGRNSSNVWVAVSNIVHTDIFYGTDNIFELNNIDDQSSTPDVVLTIEYANLSQPDVVIDVQTIANLFIPFIQSPEDDVYTLKVFESTHANLNSVLGGTKDIPNTDRLSLEDGYAAIPASQWVDALNTDYQLVVESVNNNKTLRIKKNNSDAFTIAVTGNTVFLGRRIVSLINGDAWRSARLLGSSSASSVLNEVFFKASVADGYNLVNPESERSLSIPNLQGIRYHRPGTSIDTTTFVSGDNLSFRVLADSAKVNMIGSITGSAEELGSTYNSGSLLFQYVNAEPNLFSAKVTLPKFRGYPCVDSSSNILQYYKIQRTGTSVTFKINKVGDVVSQVLTTNMAYGNSHTVNNLTGSAPGSIDLGLEIPMLHSILPQGATTSYPVGVEGDSVIVEISNLNQPLTTGISVPSFATEVTNRRQHTVSSNLKNYGKDAAYTFSGANFSNTTRPLALRAKRVKLHTSSFSYDKLEYTIEYLEGDLKVYKASNLASDVQDDLGNPELYDTNDANVEPSSLKWTLIHTLKPEGLETQSMPSVLTGFSKGRLTIRQDPTKVRKPSVSLIQLHAPRVIFQKASSHSIDNVAPSIPYLESALVSSRRIVREMRYRSDKTYNPFAVSVPIRDINNNDLSLSFPAQVRQGVNDIKFTFNSQRSLHELLTNSSVIRHGLTVPGVILKLESSIGFHPSVAGKETIWEGFVTSMPTAANILSNKVFVSSRLPDGGLKINIAQNPTVAGYPTGLDGFVQAWNTTVQSEFYGVNLTLGHVHWNSPTPVHFDIHANGVLCNLYTVHDVYNSVTRTNKRRVYKYVGIGNIDHNDSTIFETRSIAFSPSRQYMDFDVPEFDFNDDPESISNYNDKVKEIVIPSVLPAWVNDAGFNESLVIGFAFGNKKTATNLSHMLFSVPDNARKLVAMKYHDCYRVLGKFGQPIYRVNWNGVHQCLVSVAPRFTIIPALANPLLSADNSSILGHSSHINTLI